MADLFAFDRVKKFLISVVCVFLSQFLTFNIGCISKGND
ncbi:hypothetical protein FEM08_13700 [Flavobacterium gilvum]|nr:hypothetical protein FEM08_13700 [Flavobacterium gilvum]